MTVCQEIAVSLVDECKRQTIAINSRGNE
jgi:hypothetical protein